MKRITLLLGILNCVTLKSYSQEEVSCLIYDMKLAVKSKDGKFYDYLLLVGKGADTFQVIQITNNRKTKKISGPPPGLAALYLDKGKLIKKSIYTNFPYLKRRFRAYVNKVTLVYD